MHLGNHSFKKIRVEGKSFFFDFSSAEHDERAETRSGWKPKSVKTNELCIFLCAIRILGPRRIWATTHIEKFESSEKVFSSIFRARSMTSEQKCEAGENQKVWRRTNYAFSFAPLESWDQDASGRPLRLKNSSRAKKFFLRFFSEPARRISEHLQKKGLPGGSWISRKRRLLVAGCGLFLTSKMDY